MGAAARMPSNRAAVYHDAEADFPIEPYCFEPFDYTGIRSSKNSEN